MKNFREKFHTVRGYELLDQEEKMLTSGMEDYIEMIYRICLKEEFVKMGDLAKALNVTPSSANKMVNKLRRMELVKYEKYGVIEITEEGNILGEYFLHRHKTIEEFLFLLGIKNNVLEETEKVEHSISKETLTKIKLFIDFMKQNSDFRTEFLKYLEKAKS
ncbi:iron (metal) dependent repressor, DtxR family [Desulfonispora thiosulfatigenes DSM 11270]|uniref:Iron (Metal) dependent repressor, DtxR family n=1 Tax=Desulfonispora thiosulfatigenes DSM 11270 TaxID=656914 RepID=A0A1W1UKV8_DESTI|nr:iron dependent repressor, metal binding and dimerization domain protein [Desulfonispora thiosulfatigenes]SMB81758.1 iron (metal) dependent repressor, DtxR family [Desulfonispora thiosulfatigenes DSM 11270]